MIFHPKNLYYNDLFSNLEQCFCLSMASFDEILNKQSFTKEEIKNKLTTAAKNRAFIYLINSFAVFAAIAPSLAAVTIWRNGLERTSPAANKPGIEVCIYSSVSIQPC